MAIWPASTTNICSRIGGNAWTTSRCGRRSAKFPTQELWEMHRKRKRRMVSYVRERSVNSADAAQSFRGGSAPLGGSVWTRTSLPSASPAALPLTNALRCLFRDVARLKKILNNPKMPVQIVIAGKAHPKDHPGQNADSRNSDHVARSGNLQTADFRGRLQHSSGAGVGAGS